MKAPATLSLIFPLAICAVLIAPDTAASQEQAASSSTVAAAGSSPNTPSAPAKRKRSANVITAEELIETRATNAFEAVSRLRSNWLRKRGVASINREGNIVVYRDGMRFGTPESLRQINADAIESITFLDGLQATQRFGIDHGNGAILVASRR
jgi:guanyl-specific ribonuclease Sa